MQHLEWKTNPAAGPSRRPDYKEGYKRPTAQHLATLAANTVSPFDDLLPAGNVAQDTDPLATDMKNKIG